jgi:predicted lipid-binding transport protein (Tim44 family)
MRTRARQGGWVGLIGLLVALLIVFLLGRTLMKQMGLLGSPPQPASAAASSSAVRAGTATPAPVQALERAHAVDAQVQQQAREQQERIDKAAQ